MRIDETPLVYVDVETDGKSHVGGHVVEVAALRYENGECTGSVSTLINPGVFIPPFITQLTGITQDMVSSAPAFGDVADELMELFEGAAMVAHNARFDYSFLRTEFRRLGIDFVVPVICTLKLSRALYPDQPRHRLGDVIERHVIYRQNAHRAYDDANALVQFMDIILLDHSSEIIHRAVNGQLRHPSIPRYIDGSEIEALPHAPGVYFFEDEKGLPLYIGKSIDIKKRVMSHFVRDTAEHREFKMSQAVRHISFRETAGELAALLLESHLIKTLSPLYNRKLRRQRKMIVTRRQYDEQGYSVLYRDVLDMESSSRENVLATHTTRSLAQKTLLSIVKTFELCPKLSGIEKSSGACFSYHLKKCRGACIGEEPPELYNARVETAFEHRGIAPWPYDGSIVVAENGAEKTSLFEGFVIDDWIVAGTVRQEDGCEPVYSVYDATFDVDAYQIVRSYMARYPERLTIMPMQALNI